MSYVLPEKIGELFQLRPIVSLLTILAVVAILFIIRGKTVFNTRTIAYGAIAIAASFVLSYVKLFELPNGGTVTVASMLPMFLFAYVAGPRAGVAAGLCYGMLQFIQEPIMVHWVQFLLDYPLAFSMLGLAGFFRKNIYVGAIVGSSGRFICHLLSGIIFFANYAPEGQNLLLYSSVYNLSYIVPDMLICMGIMLLPSVRSAVNRLAVTTKSRDMMV